VDITRCDRVPCPSEKPLRGVRRTNTTWHELILPDRDALSPLHFCSLICVGLYAAEQLEREGKPRPGWADRLRERYGA